MAAELHYQSVSELAELIAKKELSPVELTKIYLERAENIDQPSFRLPAEPLESSGNKLASFITLSHERAIREAQQAEQEIQAGNLKGPLHGIPYGVKDLLDTAGVRTTWGSRIFANRTPTRDATVIERLTNSGAVLIGKMSQGEFAGGNTSNALNPWKLDRTSFGSSSGTVVAAVALPVTLAVTAETSHPKK